MSRRVFGILFFVIVAALCIAGAMYKYSVGASGTALRLVLLAVINLVIARFGPW